MVSHGCLRAKTSKKKFCCGFNDLQLSGMGWHGSCNTILRPRRRGDPARVALTRAERKTRAASLTCACSLTYPVESRCCGSEVRLAWLDCNTLKPQRFGSVARFLRCRRETPQSEGHKPAKVLAFIGGDMPDAKTRVVSSTWQASVRGRDDRCLVSGVFSMGCVVQARIRSPFRWFDSSPIAQQKQEVAHGKRVSRCYRSR